MPTGRSQPAPLAQGDLARTPFAHVLLYVRQRNLGGTLVIWPPQPDEERPGQVRILFEAGRPVAARLLERASRLDRGLLPLFARTSGPYAFYEGIDLTGESSEVRSGDVHVLPLIAASLRGPSRDDVVERVVRAFGSSKLRITGALDASELGLLKDELTCVELLRATPSSVDELAALSPLPPHRVRRLVYLLALVKSVEPWEGAEARTHSASSAPPQAATVAPHDLPLPDFKSLPPTEARPPSQRPRQPSARSSVRPSAESERPPPPPDDLSPGDRALWDEIAQRACSIERENYFEMLGVSRDAPSDHIHRAYLQQVKKWHPDRLPPALQELRPHVERVFRYLTRADETLTHDENRGKYLATVQDGGGTPEAERKLGLIVQAAMEFRKVEVLMRRRDWDGALRLLDDVLALQDEEPDYHATRGWILFQKSGGSPSSTVEVLTALDRALELSSDHDRAHYYKGMVLKRCGQAARATEHFERAAELNPKNIDAMREVRIAKMRSGSSARPQRAQERASAARDSLLGKLFGGKKK